MAPAQTALWRARALVTLVPATLLAGAYAFQYIGGLWPCQMCWWQRYAHFAALALALIGWLRPAARGPVALAALALAVASLLGGYHAGVEYHWWTGVTECTSAVKFAAGGDPLAAIMAAPAVRCDEVQWKLFGISMAGYNFLISGAAAATVLALLAKARKAR